LQDGDKVVIVDDLMSTGLTLCERIDRIKEVADVEIAAVVVIADLTNEEAKGKGLGPTLLAEKYGAKVYSIISNKDVEKAL
jgi:orotate phosphoribosyltransferase